MKGMGPLSTKNVYYMSAFIIHDQFAVHNFVDDDGQKLIIAVCRWIERATYVNGNGRAYFCVSIFPFYAMIKYEKCEYGLFTAPTTTHHIRPFDLFHELLFGASRVHTAIAAVTIL